MALNTSSNNNLEQLALKGLKTKEKGGTARHLANQLGTLDTEERVREVNNKRGN